MILRNQSASLAIFDHDIRPGATVIEWNEEKTELDQLSPDADNIVTLRVWRQ